MLYRNFSLADRLFNIPQYRAQYVDELESLLATQWDEGALLAELERIRQLTGTDSAATESVKVFVSGSGVQGDADYRPSRRTVIEQAIAEDSPSGQVYLLEDKQPDCRAPVTTRLTGTVKAQDGADTGAFRFTLPGGQVVNASLTFAAFEVDSLVYSVDRESKPEVVSLLLIGADVNDAFKPYVLQLFIEASDYVPGTHRFHGFATNALLFEVDESVPGSVTTLALGAQGSITITQVGTGNRAGDVELSLDATLEYGASGQ